jgi:hypothetical protein
MMTLLRIYRCRSSVVSVALLRKVKPVDWADRQEVTSASEEPDEKTLRPSKSPVLSAKPLPSKLRTGASSTRSASESSVEDYSDIAFGNNDTELDKKLANIKVRFSRRLYGENLSYS